MVARSSVELENRAIAQGTCEVIWIQKLMTDLNMPVTSPMKLFNDSKSAISVVHNPVQHDGMKHVRIDRSFIKTEIDSRTIVLSYIPTKSQETDILIKALQKSSFVCTSKLGITDIYH